MYTDFDIFTIRVGRDAAQAHGSADGWLTGRAEVAGLYEGVRRVVVSDSSGHANLLHTSSLRITAKWWQAKGAATLVTFAVDGTGFTCPDVGLVVRHAGRASMEMSLKPFRRELELAYPEDRFASALFQVSGLPGFVVSRDDDKAGRAPARDGVTRDVVEAAFAAVCLGM